MKKYAFWISAALVVVLGILTFFYYFGHGDAVKLSDFSGAYEKFDRSMAAFSKRIFVSNQDTAPAIADLERNADEALADLDTKAAARISSLTLHDGELMKVMVEIASLSRKELAALKAYSSAAAGRNASLSQLAKEYDDLTNQRQAAYDRFQKLAGR